MNLTQQIYFYTHLSQLCGSGFPLIEAIHDWGEQSAHRREKRISDMLVNALQRGQSFSQALAQCPNHFSPVISQLMYGAEQGGHLLEALTQSVHHLERRQQYRRQRQQMLMYPLILLVLLGSVSLYLLWVLVPQLVGLLVNLGAELPPLTRALMLLSMGVQQYGASCVVLSFVILLLCCGSYHWVLACRVCIDRASLRLPVVGKLLWEQALTQLFQGVALLYRQRLPLLDGLGISASLIHNQALLSDWQALIQRIQSGQSLSQACTGIPHFPQDIIKLLYLGEQSGRMDDSLHNVIRLLSTRSDYRLSRIKALFEPAVTVVLGGVLMLFIYALMMPMYDLMGQLLA